MNYKLLREYVAFGGQRYAVFSYPDLGTQNEVALSVEEDSLDAAASRLYASLSQPSSASQEQPVTQEPTPAAAQVEIYNASGELIYP